MSAWTDRLRFCTDGLSDGLVNGQIILAGGARSTAEYPSQRVSTFPGVIAQLGLVYGSSSATVRATYLESVVPWNWVRARQGHSETNALIQMRRSFAQTFSQPRNRWELLWHSARMGIISAWDGGTNLQQGSDQNAFPAYDANSSAYWPRGNRGIEAWPTASAENPNVIEFRGAIDKERIQNALGYCVGYQARIVPLNPSLPVDPSRCRIIAAVGFDLYADRAFSFPGFEFGQQNAIDGSLSRWIDIPADGQWHWVVLVTGANLAPVNPGYQTPYHTFAGVPEGGGDWPYDDPIYGGRTWAQIEAGGVNTPIDMMAFHGETPGVVPPPSPPPPVGYVHPGLATRPIWSTRSVGGFVRWGPKNRAVAVAPTWSAAPVVVGAAASAPLNATVIASGSPAPTYSLVSGPSWLSVSSAGVLTGNVPAGSQAHVATVRATNSGGTADVQVRIEASALPAGSLRITTTTLADVTVGVAVNLPIVVEGAGPYSVSAEGLPTGLSVSGSAIVGTVLLATAQAQGDYSVTITVAGASGSDQVVLPLTVLFTPEFVTTTPLLSVQAGTPFSLPIVARGGRLQPLVLSGADTEGLSIVGSSLTGVRPAAGNVTVTIAATNAVATTAQAFVLPVTAAPSGVAGWTRIPRDVEVWVRVPRDT